MLQPAFFVLLAGLGPSSRLSVSEIRLWRTERQRNPVAVQAGLVRLGRIQTYSELVEKILPPMIGILHLVLINCGAEPRRKRDFTS